MMHYLINQTSYKSNSGSFYRELKVKSTLSTLPFLRIGRLFWEYGSMNTVYCFLFAVKKFRSCKSFPSFPEKYSQLCRSAYYNWPSYRACAKVSPKNFHSHKVIHENCETFSPRTKSNTLYKKGDFSTEKHHFKPTRRFHKEQLEDQSLQP